MDTRPVTGSRRREQVAVAALLVTVGAVAEWLAAPAQPWPGIAMVAAIVAAIATVSVQWERWMAGLALVVTALAVGGTSQRLDRIERHWPDERERRIARTADELGLDFKAAGRAADHLALLAVGAARLPRNEVYRQLANVTAGDSIETSVVLFDAAGRPWAWSGRQRLAASATGDSLSVRGDHYAIVLEARRHAYDGRIAVGRVLLWADPSVLDGARAIAERVTRRTGVGVRVFETASAPDNADVFDWASPTASGDHVFFSVQTRPPEQAEARQTAYAFGAKVVLWLLLGAVALVIIAGEWMLGRALLLASLIWLPLRAPIGTVLGLGGLFAPYNYTLRAFGPFSSSLGMLGVTGSLIAIAAIGLWYYRAHRGRLAWLAGVLLALAVPAIAEVLASGIVSPEGGASAAVWIAWQLAIALVVGGLLLLAAALVRGGAVRGSGWAVVSLASAAAVGVAGTWVWIPHDGWPPWYPLLWAPVVILTVVPMSRVAASVAIAGTAGCLAALLTWQHDLTARVEAADADVRVLGLDADPFVVPYLEYFADSARAHMPTDATEIFAIWRTSALHDDGYPVQLALWDSTGRLLAQLPIDSLDVPTTQVGPLVRDLPATVSRGYAELTRLPATHQLLLTRLGPGRVLTAVVGPKSALIPPTRLGRLLEGSGRRRYPHQLTLGLPSGDIIEAGAGVRWWRDGWLLRASRLLPLDLGMREIYATIDLRGPIPLLVRGTLIVLLDLAAFALLWLVGERLAGIPIAAPGLATLVRSFRARLGFALGTFFVLPVIGFSAWSFLRLSEDSSRSRDLLVTQVLRDATVAAQGAWTATGPFLADSLRAASGRIDADLAYYEGGRLSAASAPVLADLGVVDALVSPREFQLLALRGQPEAVGGGPASLYGERIAYRVVRAGGPPELGVLASPQPGDDMRLAAEQIDLALVVLLAGILGVLLALGGATVVSRSLARPVGDLRRAALAIGRGLRAPLPTGDPPIEFAPVFAAFEKSADDIRQSRAALEAAQQRTDSVLRTVATGVVAVDAAGIVLLANARAIALLGIPLPPGRPFLDAIDLFGEPFRGVVARALEATPLGSESHELAIGDRRLLLTMTVLGGDVRGLVLALNDVTELSEAERVLAWGVMAQQVAHEIKNPLTPLRLGVQHLRRAWRDGKGNFDLTLEETSARILDEIDRLDTVARAFSRFGAPTQAPMPLDRIDIAAVARDVVQLYRLSSDGAQVTLDLAAPLRAPARADELKEVLVNLLENGRTAGGRHLTVSVADGRLDVADDGQGIPPELLPRIFEPRFSTNTSGSGLGLAIVRRLVESWGARIEVESEPGRGTVASVRWPSVAAVG